MPRFMLTYLGGEPPKTPEEGQRHFAEYRAWLTGLGDAVESPANPLKGMHTVHPDGSVTEGGSSGMSGFTVLLADDHEAALEMARSCPFLGIQGRLEVSELVEMPGMGGD